MHFSVRFNIRHIAIICRVDYIYAAAIIASVIICCQWLDSKCEVDTILITTTVTAVLWVISQ